MSKNVSNNFKNIIKAGGPFYSYVIMKLSNGTEITLTSENDFTISGTGYSEGENSGFPLGSALSKTVTLNLDNTTMTGALQDVDSDNILDTQNDEIITQENSLGNDYYYARFTLYTEADLPDGTTERIQEGVFTVIDSVAPGDVLEITGYDDMYKADTEFVSTLTYPVSAQQLLNEVCSKCDIALGSASFKNNNYQIQQAPEGLTGRQVIGYIAQIAGGNAVINPYGQLIIKSYDFSDFVDEDVIAGEIETESGIHILSEYINDPDISTDDVTITGVSTTIESEDSDEDETYLVGSEYYAIKIDNPLIVGNEKTAIDLIADSIIGITMRPFSGTFMPDPTIEFMDLCYVIEKRDATYKSFITSHDFDYIGSSNVSCGVESPERYSGTYYSNASEVYQKAKKQIQNNKTQWEQAIENLSQQVANASGLYTTEETQPDGSTIFYMHNKPTLEESDIVWKMTAETLTVSTDGGKTWNAGITVNGQVIAQIMSTIGINFDWGVGGTLIIQDASGNQTAYIDAETGTVRLSVEELKIVGKTVEEIANEESETVLNDFVDSVYTPTITNLQNQIDGQIETWFYSYIPTAENYPASEWTTDTEKDKHLGDLFYVVDNTEYGGQAYRWAKIGTDYLWDYVEDTAVVKALSDAAAAQDTADQKRRVFVVTPYPPYDVGDLWVGDDTSEMMRCQVSRQSGNYVSTDWIKAVKYTDDTELYNFIQTDYTETIQEIYDSVDQKSETWYQSEDPSLNWAEKENVSLSDMSSDVILDVSGEEITTIFESEKSKHDGDLWKDSDTNVEYIYKDGVWIEMPIPDAVFDEIDGKAQIFVVQPTPPYNIGDTWFTGTTILVCNTRRDSGEFVQSDWAKNDNYTDDSALYDFIEGDYAKTIEEIQAQTDQKAETWYQSTDPSSNWTTDEKAGHAGDLWYNTTEQKTYIYNGSAWDETKSTPPDEVFDSIDGKAQIFVSTPAPPYSVGDLWFNSASSDIMTCVTSRSSGSFNASDWEKRNKYTDDSALNEFLSGEYSETITELKTQADKKAETWYQGTDPSTSWNATQKAEHEGDLWYNTSNQKTYIYDGSAWQETKSTPPDEVFDSIDGKAQIFISRPTPPYSKGDLWFDSTTSDIMTCIASRSTGSFNAGDWQKRNKYTDDSYAQEINAELNEFISNYQDEITEIQSQIDKKAETWYQPTDPSLQWTDAESDPLQDTTGASIFDTTGATIVTIYESEKALHDGDLWHDTTNNKEYIYVDGEWQETSIPDDVFDIIDGKAQIFVSTPTPPYAIGDLWFNSDTSDIMTCINNRNNGSYVEGDWQKRNKYTDDTYAEQVENNLNNFSEAVTEDMDNLQTQIDGKIETWYYNYQPTLSNIPASQWTTTSERQKHVGDLFYWQSQGYTYRFQQSGSSFAWQKIQDSDISDAMEEASKAQDTADSKRRVFVTTPVPPYDVGDLWCGNSSSDLKRCQTARSSGSYVASDWIKAVKYTDDSALYEFIEGDYSETVENLKNQADKKAETWYQSTDPSTGWTAAEKQIHTGDLWFNTSSSVQKSYRWNGSSWQEMKTTPPPEVFDEIDGKAQIFVSTPKPPYSVGDLWFNSTTSDIMTCITARSSGSYTASDWQKRNKYTDDSAVNKLDESLNQQEVFDRLTNGGTAQGIYIKDGNIFVNASYIQSGTMSADRIYGGTLSLGGVDNSGGVFNLYDENGTLKSVMDNDGFNFWDGEKFVGSIRTRYMEEYERGCCAICADNVSIVAISSDYILDNDPDSKIFNSDIYMTNTTIYVDGTYKLPGTHFPKDVYFENNIFVGENGIISESALSSSKVLKINVSPGDDIWIGANSNAYGDTEIRMYGDVTQMRDPSRQSDERLKTEITQFSKKAIDVINNIQIYGYTWIESGESEKAGFIAQQLEHDVDADLTRIGKDGVHNVKPTKIIPYLVKSVQELSKEIELLKKEICELKGETYIPKESKKDKWKPSDMSLEEKREFIKSLRCAEMKK